MVKVWNEGKPAMANAISADIPDIEENAEFLSLWVKERRSVFTYNGGSTAYTVKCKSAFYYCKDKVCWWDAELTTGAIGGPGGDDWYYLYLDNSGITSGTEITNSELLWSNTEPAWSDTYAGWYNGDDRCIFAAFTNDTPNNILEFFHEGDLVVFADIIADLTPATDIDDSWTNVTLTIPKFARVAEVSFLGQYDDGATICYWRTDGQTGATGHICGYVSANTQESLVTQNVITSTSQIIEVVQSASNANTMRAYTHGWYFPIGL